MDKPKFQTKDEYKQFIKDGYEVQRTARLELCKLLHEHGPMEFDWENSEAPSIASTQFEDDLADCYVTKMYNIGDECVYADLHAYYLGEDKQNVDLVNDECNIDWLDLLDWVVERVM